MLTSDVMEKLASLYVFWNQPNVVSQIPQMAKVVSWVKAHYYGNVTDNKTLHHEFERMLKESISYLCRNVQMWLWFQVMDFEQQMPLQLGASNGNTQQLSK